MKNKINAENMEWIPRGREREGVEEQTTEVGINHTREGMFIFVFNWSYNSTKTDNHRHSRHLWPRQIHLTIPMLY